MAMFRALNPAAHPWITGLLALAVFFGGVRIAAQDEEAPIPDSLEVADLAEEQASFDHSVTYSGAFTQSLMLDLPAGIRGLQPSLSLQYSSQAEMGIAGVGWDLELPRITLNPAEGYRPRAQSVDLDRHATGDPVERYASHLGPIDVLRDEEGVLAYLFNPNNDLRLRTAVDEHGTEQTGSDVAAWEVTGKDGTRFRYGHYDHSSLFQDRDSPEDVRKVAWYLDRAQDVFGNRISYYYELYPESQDEIRQPVLRAIEYGHRPGPPNAQTKWVVFFEYIESDWRRFSYQLGTRIDERFVLDEVCVYPLSDVQEDRGNEDPEGNPRWRVDSLRDQGPIHCYELTYDFEDSTSPRSASGRPLLLEVQKQAGDGTSLPPWKFSYTHAGASWKSALRDALAAPTGSDGHGVHVTPDTGLYLSQSRHDLTQLMADLDGDGDADFLRGAASGDFPVYLRGADDTYQTAAWDHPLRRDADPVYIRSNEIDAKKDSGRSNCWYDFEFDLQFTGARGGLGFTRALTAAPDNFYDLYERSGASDEAESSFKSLGAFQFLSNSYYGPFPSIGSEGLAGGAAERIYELETYGSYKDSKPKEYAFDWRTTDCQDWGDKVDVDYCWNLSTGRSGNLGSSLSCLDDPEGRWFANRQAYPKTASYASRLWELRDLDGDGRLDWVFAAPLLQRDAEGSLRKLGDGANDWYVAFGNGEGWDTPVPWTIPRETKAASDLVERVRATGRLAVSVGVSSAAASHAGVGIQLCGGFGGVGAAPTLGSRSLPTSPGAAVRTAASMGLQQAGVPQQAAQIATSSGSLISSLGSFAVCAGFDRGGFDVRAYLPLLGDTQSIEGDLTGESNLLFQDTFDLDGDGRPDLVSARWEIEGGIINPSDHWLYYRNTGSGFDIPELFRFHRRPTHPYGGEVKSLQEQFSFRYGKTRWFGPSGNLSDDAYYGMLDRTAGLADLNGDGLLDLVATVWHPTADANILPGEALAWAVYFNEGDDFGDATSWAFEDGWSAPDCTSLHLQPVLSSNVYYEDPASDTVRDSYVRQTQGLFDVDGDGLLDYWHLEPYDGEAGVGADGSCGYVPTDKITSNSREDWISMTDPRALNTRLMVRLNTGTGFAPPTKWTGSEGYPLSGMISRIYPAVQGLKLPQTTSYGVVGTGDLDRDGVAELAVLRGEGTGGAITAYDLYDLTLANADRLATLETPFGGRVEVSYRHHREEGGEMMGGVWVVDEVAIRDLDGSVTADGSDVLSRRRYEYEGGLFDREARRFRGFERVYQYQDAAPGYTLSRYLQDEGFEGLLFCREVRSLEASTAGVSQRSAASIGAAPAVGEHLRQLVAGRTAERPGYRPAVVFGSATKARTPITPRIPPADDAGGPSESPASAPSEDAPPEDTPPEDAPSDDSPGAEDPLEAARYRIDEARPYDGTAGQTPRDQPAASFDLRRTPPVGSGFGDPFPYDDVPSGADIT
ncbi:MAG: SpvB/TcaC N-terminal domain-containing protein, partial [Acidobacteriota bacterium]